MKNLLFMMIVAVNTVALVGCSKDNPAPMPQSGFVVSKTLIESGEVVSFTNNSQNAIRYEWDFGNGQSATIQNPTMQYNQPGSYVVSLSAFNEDNQAQVSTIIVKVGERYLKSFTIKQISFLDQSGLAHDSDGSGPDIFFYAGKAYNPKEYYTFYFENLKPDDLPITLNMEQTNVKLSDEDWRFELYDLDPLNEALMVYWSFNPKQYSRNNKIEMSGLGYLIDLNYEIR